MTQCHLTMCRSFGWMSQCWPFALLDFVVLVQVVRSWDFDRGFRDSFEKWYELCPNKTKFNIQCFFGETFSNIDLILLFRYVPSIGSLIWEPNQANNTMSCPTRNQMPHTCSIRMNGGIKILVPDLEHHGLWRKRETAFLCWEQRMVVSGDEQMFCKLQQAASHWHCIIWSGSLLIQGFRFQIWMILTWHDLHVLQTYHQIIV